MPTDQIPAPSILRPGDRVRIGASARTGTIKQLYDEPDGAGQSYALIETPGGFDARPVAELNLVAEGRAP
jgi:hypothetical protein